MTGGARVSGRERRGARGGLVRGLIGPVGPRARPMWSAVLFFFIFFFCSLFLLFLNSVLGF
jgi:hypothetical protein